ncbi:hypothetical protein TNCV_5088551 [Trichonephila clavipes]|nr:hypothetical protein TNCV_5088551 [Trichonephila clavipes]
MPLLMNECFLILEDPIMVVPYLLGLQSLVQMHANKYEPIVQEVELIEPNPDYAHVKLSDGRETTVSIRHLAQRGKTTRFEDNKCAEENVQVYPDQQPINSDSAITLKDSTEQNRT